ncbi:unnamed protein product [Spirodela intermedia]|uniref:GST N-terminal domain-containing protein n=2 Tax=Spirodela intermedia TaxID=51605 RepID=A0A7I8KFR9_SPIIN|nr:unnamed protein product [Spirodela intermedia]CAA6660216.1 unnamed protein product [Spirodela intermedia]CAA7396543.1 unnamed protein product [Spirodela intermedia]
MSSLYVSYPVLFFKSGHSNAPEVCAPIPKAAAPRLESPCASLKIRGSRERSFRGIIFRVSASRTETDSENRTQASAGVVNSPNDGGSSSGSFLSILCPLLKLFAGGDPSQERNEFLEVTTSSLSSLARLPWGTRSYLESSKQKDNEDSPLLRLQLYEFEACPFCRRVREAMTELDLSVEVYPCPKGSVRHRQMVQKLGGKEQFPFLFDPNSGTSMYESGDIVKYLFQQYGGGRNPSFGLMESTLFTGWMPTLLRAGRGMTLWNKARLESPSEKLELFSYENNPQARIVREALCELELPYILHNVGDGSSKAESLVQISGSNKVPYLIDNNTGTKLGDSKKILSYLFETYRTGN